MMEPLKKKTRKAYTYARKAEILNQYYLEKAEHIDLSLSTFASEVGFNKSMLSSWMQIQDEIFQSAFNDRIMYLKKGRGSNEHQKTFL